MRITIPVVLAALLMSGCATDGRFSRSRHFDSSRADLDACDDTGGTPVKLHYGFSGNSSTASNRIRITGLVHVRAGEIFAIELSPKNNRGINSNVDFADSLVTITGKDMPSAWLHAGPASYKDTDPDHELVICVPPNQEPGPYYYNIEIQDAGSLDPRADVC